MLPSSPGRGIRHDDDVLTRRLKGNDREAEYADLPRGHGSGHASGDRSRPRMRWRGIISTSTDDYLGQRLPPKSHDRIESTAAIQRNRRGHRQFQHRGELVRKRPAWRKLYL